MDLILSNRYTQEETPIMFDKPKKKKSYRKKESLDIEPIEAEAKSTVFDIGDLEEDQEIRKRAFDSSWLLPKADEESKPPLSKNNSTIEEDESAETLENKIVFSEMDLWSQQLAESVENFRKPAEDFFVEKKVGSEEIKAEVIEENNSFVGKKVDISENTDPVEVLHEKPVRSFTDAVPYLRERGFLERKEVEIERKDKSGRDMTQKEAFRQLSHIIHGKKPGKKKQEKRMRKNEEELRTLQMGSSDTQSHWVKRMKQMQAQQGTHYLLL